MDLFPLFDVTYDDLKRIITKMNNTAWIEFQATCKKAHEVSLATNRRYFLDITGENVLSIGRNSNRRPYASSGPNQQIIDLSDDVVTQEANLHNALGRIGNPIFSQVNLSLPFIDSIFGGGMAIFGSVSEARVQRADDYQRYVTSLLRTARFFKQNGIKARSISWEIQGLPEVLEEFIKSLDAVKITCAKMDNYDFLNNLPPLVSISTRHSTVDRKLLQRTKILKLSLDDPDARYRVFDIIRMLKSTEPRNLYVKTIILTFVMESDNQENFMSSMSSLMSDSFTIDRTPLSKFKTELFFGYTESERISTGGSPIPIFTSIYFESSKLSYDGTNNCKVDVWAKISLVTNGSQIEFAPNLPHFPKTLKLPPEFIKMKEEMCDLLEFVHT